MRMTVNGIELFYERTGKGAPLILLHGNGEDHHIFDKISTKLCDHFECFALDSRNHGQSARTKDFSYDAMAEDIRCFIDSLSLGKVNLLGFSDGAIASLLLAMRRPDRIRKMALLGVNLKPCDFTEENLLWIQQSYEESNDPLLLMMLEQPNIELDDVRGLGIPTLLVAAENDLFRPRLYAELAQALPDAQLVIMKGHEHDSYIVDQDMLYPDLLRFYTGLD